jgi:hypothetical protein
MSEASPQNLKNHGRLDPPFHLFVMPVFAAALIIAIVHLVRHFNFHSGLMVVLAIAAIILVVKVRMYSIKVQDRVIRLEERLRLQSLAPQEWHAQFAHLSEDQLIGLRFAGDDEVVSLAKLALEQKLTRKQIKERIKSWRADDWRV